MRAHLRTVIERYQRSRKSGASEDIQALKCLDKNISFRLPASSAKDKLVGFKCLARLAAAIWRSDAKIEVLNPSAKFAILELTDRFQDLEVDYVERQSGESIKIYLNKVNLLGLQGKGQRLAIILRLVRFGFGNAIRCISHEDRSNLAMIPVYLAEISSLIHILDDQQITDVYDFAPYDVDSNFGFSLLNEAGYTIHKLPSPGPLTSHNHTIYAHELILSCEYQFDEIKTLPNIKVDQMVKWLPEYAFNYIDQYSSNAPIPDKKTIGYYSHASWARHALDHPEGEIRMEEAEELTLNFLRKIMTESNDFQLTIFLHPREKAEGIIQGAEAYFKSQLPGIPFEFGEAGKSTAQLFGAVDIGVGAFSTVLYERLFCGYKTLICNHSAVDFPLPNTGLANICFDTFERFKILMNACFDQSQEAYFASNDLNGYHFSDYPYFSMPK